MRIIISPAKQMRVDTDTFTCRELPVFWDRAKILKDWICCLTYEQQRALWACSDKIARQNAARFADMDLGKNLTPALLSYDGIQYTYMAPAVFEDGQYEYVQEHLRILSGFYGIVKPMDGVVPYRLEMQAKAAVAGNKNLYEFWGDSLYREVLDDSRIIINLASREYSKCIEKYLKPEDRYITCVFGDLENGKMPVMLYNFGGAIVNLFTAVVCTGLSFLCPVRSLGWTVLMMFAVIGLAFALMNGLPLRMGPVNNDGKNALDLSRSEEATRAFWIQMKVNELVSKGDRLKDMPEEWFTLPPGIYEATSSDQYVDSTTNEWWRYIFNGVRSMIIVSPDSTNQILLDLKMSKKRIVH